MPGTVPVIRPGARDLSPPAFVVAAAATTATTTATAAAAVRVRTTALATASSSTAAVAAAAARTTAAAAAVAAATPAAAGVSASAATFTRRARCESPSARGASAFFARFIDGETATLDVAPVHRLNRCLRLLRSFQFDEAKAPRLSGHAIRNDLDVTDGSERREKLFQVLLSEGERQIADVEPIGHRTKKLLATSDRLHDRETWIRGTTAARCLPGEPPLRLQG